MNVFNFSKLTFFSVLLNFSNSVFATEGNVFGEDLIVRYSSDSNLIFLEAKNIPLPIVLREISNSTGVEFLGNIDTQIMSITYKNRPLGEVIDSLLKSYSTAKTFLPASGGEQVLLDVSVLGMDGKIAEHVFSNAGFKLNDSVMALSEKDQQIAKEYMMENFEFHLEKIQDFPSSMRNDLIFKNVMMQRAQRVALRQLERDKFEARITSGKENGNVNSDPSDTDSQGGNSETRFSFGVEPVLYKKNM